MLKINNKFKELLPPLTEDQKAGLEQDILLHGCLEPLIIWNDTLIDGHHRYDICQKHDITYEIRNMQFDSEMDTMYWCWSNQKNRRNLSKYELIAKALMFEDWLVEKARERMLIGKKIDPTPTLAEGEKGETRDQIAKYADSSHGTVDKVKAIEAKAPEEIKQKLKKQEISINKAYGEIKKEEKRTEVLTQLNDIKANEIKKIKGLYDVIVIDPPWPIKKIERDIASNQVEFDYPTMTIEEIEQINISYTDNCHIWLWTTHKFLPIAFNLLQKWDLKYICTFVWHKNGGFQPFDLPQYNCEFCLYARKGTPFFVDLKDFFTCFNAPRTKHSEKPEQFYEIVRRVTAGRRLDMFNRRNIDGFDGWGNELD